MSEKQWLWLTCLICILQIYSQYVEVSDALQQEKDENIRLKQYLDQILKVNLVQISDLVNGMKTFPLSWVFHFPYTAVLKWSIICYTACHFKDFFLFSCFFMSLLSSLLSLLHYIHYNLIVYKKKHFDNWYCRKLRRRHQCFNNREEIMSRH